MLFINNNYLRIFSLGIFSVLGLLTTLFIVYFLLEFRWQPVQTIPKALTIVSPDSLEGNKTATALDTVRYNRILQSLVHGRPASGWPVKASYPLHGAILPFNRVVAYYGNFYAQGMGILGELPGQEMLERLKEEVARWQRVDPATPVVPAIHYIAVTAQDNPGKDHKYRLRMPASEINKALDLAQEVKGIVFLDIQVGLSTIQDELPQLEPYLKLPNVHLGIDPEYSMKGGQVPCTVIGTYDAEDINYSSEYLAGLVRKYHLSPKILVVHRFTKEMVTNYKKIVTRPEIQIVMNMDGFGPPAKKIDSYKSAIVNEPVQFTGFKLFYKYDIDKGHKSVMRPQDVLDLYPVPVYIQYSGYNFSCYENNYI